MEIPKKYIFAGIFIFIVFVILIIFLMKKNVDISGPYSMFPMKGLKCQISKTDKVNTFKIKYDISLMGNVQDTKMMENMFKNTINKKATITLTGKKNPLGHEVIYTEFNDNKIDKFPGVFLTKTYDTFAIKDDIIIDISDPENINYKSKCIEHTDEKECLKNNCKYIGYICYDKTDKVSGHESIVFKSKKKK
jgi:hypothetical protein